MKKGLKILLESIINTKSLSILIAL